MSEYDKLINGLKEESRIQGEIIDTQRDTINMLKEMVELQREVIEAQDKFLNKKR